MEPQYTEIETTVESVNCKGEPIKIDGVKAIKDHKSGQILVYPFEIAKAEIKQIAKSLNILPRDVGTLIMLGAKPGNFNDGDVFYKYHLQKMLFYQWKYLEKHGYGDALPRDNFIAAENGPVPEQLNADLDRLESQKLIRTKYQKTEYGRVRKIELTANGKEITDELWCVLCEPYKQVTLEVKEKIYPMTPEKVRHAVHREYPEYRDTYVKNDIE
jgi:DNA-binding PadR family transcriptional regulator